jgi:hypothetical protein
MAGAQSTALLGRLEMAASDPSAASRDGRIRFVRGVAEHGGEERRRERASRIKGWCPTATITSGKRAQVARPMAAFLLAVFGQLVTASGWEWWESTYTDA